MRLKYLAVLFAFVLFALIYLSPYLLNEYHFAIGFDSGYYLYKAQAPHYTFWDDPVYFVFFSALHAVTGVELLTLYKLLPVLFSLLALPALLLIFRSTGAKNSSAVISLLLLMLSLVVLKGHYYAFHKQIIASILLLYLLYFCMSNRNPVLLALLFSAIFLSHKGVALLALVVVASALWIYSRQARLFFKQGVVIGVVCAVVLAPYLVPRLPQYVDTLQDALRMSYGSLHAQGGGVRSTVGRSLVTDKGNVNPFVDVLAFMPLFFSIAVIGAVIALRKRSEAHKLLLTTTLFLAVWMLLKANFSNRFALNLVLVSAAFIPLVFDAFTKKRLAIVSSLLVVLAVVSAVHVATSQQPYVFRNMEGVAFIEQAIPAENTYFFATDYLQVTLGQMNRTSPLTDSGQGIVPAVIAPDTDIEEGIDLYQADEFMLHGHTNLTLLRDYNLTGRDIYVVVGVWESRQPLPRASTAAPVNISAWDTSSHYEKIYEGEHEIIRIYRFKHEND